MKKTNEKTEVDQYGTCPTCGESWDGGEIFDTFRDNEAYKHLSDFELYEMIRNSYSPPYRWSRLRNVEYIDKYDGIWEYVCPDCGATFPSINQIRRTP